MTTTKEHIKWLQEHYKPNEVLAIAIWTIEDVFSQAEERKLKITKKEAEDILVKIENNQNANLGVTWDTIDAYLDDLAYEKKSKPKWRIA